MSSGSFYAFHPLSLHDVIHSNKKLVLVFEFVEMDLKKYMNQFKDKGMDMLTIKVFLLFYFSRSLCTNYSKESKFATKTKSFTETLNLRTF